jgi:hypothetical protein
VQSAHTSIHAADSYGISGEGRIYFEKFSLDPYFPTSPENTYNPTA